MLTNNHIVEIQQLEDTTDDTRQVILYKRRIKAQKKRQVRIRQSRELLLLEDTQRHTSMTTDEQRETIRKFKPTQKTERKRSYNESTNDTAWQNTLFKTTRPYASKHEMTRHYEIQRKGKLQFRTNNNLPIAQFNRTQENSASRRKRNRQDEQQESHEKRMRQDMERALDIEQQQ